MNETMAFDWRIVYHAVECVMTFFIIGCIGYFLAKKSWFSEESSFLFSRLTTLVALPPYLLYNINAIMTKQELLSFAYGLVVPIVSISINTALSILVSDLMRVPSGRRGIFRSSFAFSNTIYIGLPVNLALFGQEALPYVLLYYFGNTCFFWTIGNYFLASDNDTRNATIFSLATLRKIFSPPMLGLMAGMLLLSMDLKLPTFLANTCRYLGNLTTPLVILSLGVTLFDLGLSRIRFSRELAAIILARFVLSPLVVILVTSFYPVPELMRQVFIIQSSLPVMSSIAMMSHFYKSDVDYATIVVSSTTVMALVTIPLFMVAVTYWI